MQNDQSAPARARFKIPTWVQHILKIALGVAAIWGLVHSGALDPVLVGRAITGHPWLCAASFLSYAVFVVLPAWLRWLLLIRLAGLRAPSGRVFSLHMIGIFFNSLVPGGTGGDLIKGYYLYHEHEDKDKAPALTSIVMDRFVGLYALLCTAMIMTAINYGLWKDIPLLRFNSLFYSGVFLGFTGAIAFFFSPWSNRFLAHPALYKLPGGGMLKSLFDSLIVYRARPGGLLMAVLLGMVVDFGLILLYYFFALSLGLHLPLIVHGFVVPTLTMVNGVPIAPSGIGLGEAAGAWMYRMLGVSEGGSEILALVHICIMAMSLVCAPFYFFYRARPKRI